MRTKNVNGKVFTVCSLVLLWSLIAVVGAQADQNQFNDNNNGTVYDAATDLTWQKDGHYGPFSWQQSLAYVETLNTGSVFGGCRGWRLHTSKELESIVDHSKPSGSAQIDTDYFPDTLAEFYWSSSSFKQTLKYAISFGDGRQRTRSSANQYYVRAVRSECDPADNDGDGFMPDSDCNDNDPNINPAAVEMCDGYVDNNCDGNYDLTCWDADNDGDGQTENQGDCDDRDPHNFTGNSETCDGMDNDCDSVADNGLTFDVDGDGYSSTTSCSGSKDDCNDNDVAINPGAVEICDDIDNNCDGSKDENLTQPSICGVGECASTGTETCVHGVWQNNCVAGNPAAEICDGKDNNCDGSIDEDLTQPTTCGVGECASTGTETCTAGVWGGDTCVPGNPIAEVCDTKDNDCDGVSDEGLTFDNDHDTHSTPGSCEGTKDDCDDNDVYNFPGNDEVCDGRDNNCLSGTADEVCAPSPVESAGGGSFETVQDAYDAVADFGADIIKMQALEFSEGLLFDDDVEVTLAGGYDEFFNEPSAGWTIIHASGGPAMVIRKGKVIVEYVKLL